MADNRNLILSVNAGSSSLKISAFTILPDSQRTSSAKEPVSLTLSSSIENLTAPPARFSFKPTSSSGISPETTKKDEEVDDDKISDHKTAFAYFLSYLEQNTAFEKSHVKHVCHRVVHGGRYAAPVKISSESFHHIELLSDLAPL